MSSSPAAATTEADVAQLDARQLEAALEASMARAARGGGAGKDGKPLDITAEEADSLKKAFQKPEFRTLFQDYLQEISDPKNKKEYDDYLQSLEAKGQVPENVNIVRPKAGFCVKVKTVGKEEPRKVFVNVCSSDQVELPESHPVTQKDGRKGETWRLPHFVGPQHVEQDKKGTACETYDVCYHPSALMMGETNPAFKDMLTRTALEAVVNAVHKVRGNKDYALGIDNYHVLVGRKCIGEKPGTLNVPKGHGSNKVNNLAAKLSGSQAASNGAKSSTEAAEQANNKKAEGSWSKKGFLNKKKSSKAKDVGKRPGSAELSSSDAGAETDKKAPLIKEASSKDVDAKRKEEVRNADGTLQPVFTVVHRGTLELGNYMTDLTHMPQSTRPKELVVSISLPAISSARSVDLDVSETHLKIKVPKIYALCAELPYPVDDEKGRAKFDKARRTLVVTLPVRPPVFTKEELEKAKKRIAPPSNADSEVATQADRLKGKDPEVAGIDDDESVDDADYVLVDVPATEHSGNGNPYLNPHAQKEMAETHESLSAEIARRAAEAVAAEKARQASLPRPVEKYVCKQTATSVTILVPTPNVDQASARVDFQAQKVTATFSTVAPVGASAEAEAGQRLNFELCVNLGGEILPADSRFSVSSKNVVLILTKVEAGLWENVELTNVRAAQLQATSTKDKRSAGSTAVEDVAVASGEKFVPSETYSGRRPGYVFCTGIKGLGYYRDTGPFQNLDAQFAGDVASLEPVLSGTSSDSRGKGGISSESVASMGGKDGEILDAAAAGKSGDSNGVQDDDVHDGDLGSLNVFENNFMFELD
eukprot:INCI18103.3.p1 GENE.INCI18103.3~~INCI18103.3.p1  ORF type:complete len:820 (+),score=182.98 INCI18103.3:409-2868(+)